MGDALFCFIAERRQKENAGHGTARLYASEWISTEINIQKKEEEEENEGARKQKSSFELLLFSCSLSLFLAIP